MKRLLYVSRSRLAPETAEAAVEAIVAAARRKNSTLGITGGLIWTGKAFAQVLEGEPAAVDALMAIIAADPRHSDVRIVSDVAVDRRAVPDWSMAYAGGASYVSLPVEGLLEGVGPHEATHVRRLMDLVREFAV